MQNSMSDQMLNRMAGSVVGTLPDNDDDALKILDMAKDMILGVRHQGATVRHFEPRIAAKQE